MNPRPAPNGDPLAIPGRLLTPTDRRRFLKWSGAAAATAVLVSCDQPTEPAATAAPMLESANAATAGAAQVTIDLANDVGILNFAYALEQLEAAFYTRVVDDFYAGAPSVEQELLRDIKSHEVIHREFFAAALGSAAIPKLAVNFDSVDFGSRDQVLGTARALEDTGVGAYNGAGAFVRNSDYLLIAGKIVSVEARHASAIRDVIGRSFAPQAFDPALTFEQAFRRAAPFIATRIALTNSPTAGMASRTSDQEMDA
jgi:hypothetical protein